VLPRADQVAELQVDELRLRLDGPGEGVRSLGTGALPTPMTIPLAGLTESTEGRLATTTGRLTTKPKKSSGGDTTLVIERAGAGPIKVMADASSRINPASLTVGATYRITGDVGQRATRSGALDGYRVWARDPADLVVIARPSPSGSPSPTAGASGTAVATMSIGKALHVSDRTVAIEAIVTAPATLLDASGRRIVVQDYLADEDPQRAEVWERVERLRDPDHRRLPRPGEVPELLAEHGFGEDEAQTWTASWSLDDWLEMAEPPYAAEAEIRLLVGSDRFELTAWRARFTAR